jgi:hypothetical protein
VVDQLFRVAGGMLISASGVSHGCS